MRGRRAPGHRRHLPAWASSSATSARARSMRSASPQRPRVLIGQVSPQAVLGVVSLIFWSLIIVISIKYAILIMRADNHGEGGILALLALISPRRAKQSRRRAIMVRDRPNRGDLALRRRHHHAGHFRPERNRGHQGLCPPNGACRRPANGGDPRLLVHDPAQRHRLDRRHIRAGHANLVRGGRRPWHCGNCQDACRAGRPQSFAGHHLSVARWALGLCGDRRRFPRGDRRRGILRRHGPFRAVSDPRRLVRRGVAGADPQLFRPRRTAAHRARRHRQPFLSARPGMVTLRSGRAGDGGHRDRLPGGHLRRLFLDAASHSARLPAAHEHRPHRRSRDRPDLYPVRQLDARRGHARRRHRLRLLGRAGRRLWHSRFVTDGDHDADGDVRRIALEVQSHPRLWR